ncbi:hypothetical protein TNCV_464091 [Trichonephila clavipes]|nr:hypothetical protein TNCV_464091 [Trichonephila clavipes]
MRSISPKSDFSSTGKRIQKGYQIWRIYRCGEKTLGAIMSSDYKELETISKARYDKKSTCNGNKLSDPCVQRDNKTCI